MGTSRTRDEPLMLSRKARQRNVSWVVWLNNWVEGMLAPREPQQGSGLSPGICGWRAKWESGREIPRLPKSQDSCQNRTEQGSEGAPWEQRFKPNLEVCLPGILGLGVGRGRCLHQPICHPWRGTEKLRPMRSWLECAWHMVTVCLAQGRCAL